MTATKTPVESKNEPSVIEATKVVMNGEQRAVDDIFDVYPETHRTNYFIELSEEFDLPDIVFTHYFTKAVDQLAKKRHNEYYRGTTMEVTWPDGESYTAYSLLRKRDRRSWLTLSQCNKYVREEPKPHISFENVGVMMSLVRILNKVGHTRFPDKPIFDDTEAGRLDMRRWKQDNAEDLRQWRKTRKMLISLVRDTTNWVNLATVVKRKPVVQQRTNHEPHAFKSKNVQKPMKATTEPSSNGRYHQLDRILPQILRGKWVSVPDIVKTLKKNKYKFKTQNPLEEVRYRLNTSGERYKKASNDTPDGKVNMMYTLQPNVA